MDCAPFIIGKHYAHRWPSVSLAFGLFFDDAILGVVTYGTPASAPLRSGVAGPDMAGNVLELNRLCFHVPVKNEASRLVSGSIKIIDKDAIIVSFADIDQGHIGYVYQACNFTYYGLSAKRTDWKIRGKENLHGQTIADEFRGSENRAQCMREKYGDDFYLSPRSRKHRYIIVTGTKQFKRKATGLIRYKALPYPKKETP